MAARPPQVDDFFSVPTDTAPSKWASASTRRSECPGARMLIDRLLELSGLELSYPPQDVPQLQKWVSALDRDAVELGELQKHALRLYLLLDLEEDRPATQAGSAEDGALGAEAYAYRFFMPSNFVAAIKGYWALDNADYSTAVACLARPGVDIDLPLLPVIIELLSQDAPRQLVRFTQIARSQLTDQLSPLDLSRIVKALAESGQVNEAFKLLRDVVEAQPEDRQEDELRGQMDQVLRTILGANITGQPVPEALRQLLHQPLTMQQDKLLCDVARAPMEAQLPTTANDLLLDLILNRLIAQGRHLEALRLLNGTAIQPASTEAARRRSLLYKSLKSVLTDVDLSVLSLDPESDAAKRDQQQQDQSMGTDSVDVDMGQHPWAPQDLPEEPPAARSLAEAQRNAQSRAQALREAASVDRKNAPLSASPALRKAQKHLDAHGGHKTDAAANHIIETLRMAAMSKSPSHFQLTRSPSISRQGSPAAALAASDVPRSRASGSPFVSRPASTLRHDSSRAAGPSTVGRVGAPHAIADVSINDSSLSLGEAGNMSMDSPIRPRTRGRKQAHINIKIPPTPKARADSRHNLASSKSKRSAPQPQEDAGPSKMQALDPDTTVLNELPKISTPKPAAKQRKQTRMRLEPAVEIAGTTSSRSRGKKSAEGRLPGHFDMDAEDHSEEDQEGSDFASRRTDTEVESDEDDDDMMAEPFSALTQTSSIRKPRHIRANAPEPPTPAQPLPTPRRSARLSASVSREASVDSVASHASTTATRKRNGGSKNSSRPAARALRARRAESLVEEDEEDD